MDKIKILLVDDHEVVRVGLGLIIGSSARFKVVGYAKNYAETLAGIENELPDIIVLDIRLQGENGIDICREIKIKYPSIKILILTSFGDDELVMQAIMAGANGYLLKEVGNDELIQGLETLADGGSLLDPATTVRVLSMMKNMAEGKKPDSLRDKLSEQEYKILALLGEGKTNNEIGENLNLSPKTIKNYVSNLLSKLELNNRAEAAVFSVKNGIKL